MEPFLAERYGNPSAAHALGRDAVRALDEAREVVSDLLGCAPSELVFTSGGTESDVHAVSGGLPVRTGRVLCSAVEHPAVLRTVEAMGGSTVRVGADGRVDLDELAQALASPGPSEASDDVGPDRVSLVSVMTANNELGTINDIDAVAGVLAEHPTRTPTGHRVTLHTDAVQAAPWLDVAQLTARADLVSISAHKFGGPKGVSALVVRSGASLRPLLPGGGQEWGLRSGTTNVAGAVGMAAAFAVAAGERDGNGARVAALRDRLAGQLCTLDGVRRSVPAGTPVLPGTLHLIVDGVDSEPLLFLLDESGVLASAASACSSGAAAASHVLEAIGIDLAAGGPRAALRLSLGHDITEGQVEVAAGVVRDRITRLRSGAALAGGRT